MADYLHDPAPPSSTDAYMVRQLQRVAVVYPGDRRYAIADRVEAVPSSDLATPGRLFDDGQGEQRDPRRTR